MSVGVGIGSSVFGILVCIGTVVGVVKYLKKRNNSYNRLERERPRQGPIYFDPNSGEGGRVHFSDSREGIDQLQMRTFFETESQC